MKVAVELSEKDLRNICRATGIAKKGPAIRRMLEEALRLRRRAEIAEKFVSGEWSAELDGFEAAREADRSDSLVFSESWRD